MSNLLKPITIGALELLNRFVRSATHDGFSTEEGEITDGSVELVRGLARGGVGLVITGFAYVTPRGQAFSTQAAVHNDRFIPGLRRLAGAVHGYDAKTVLQIGDSGSQSAAALDKGIRPLAPSAFRKEWMSFGGEGETTQTEKGTPEYRTATTTMETVEMTEDDIQETIDAYGQGARRAREAGFDGVQFHGGHGYLISQFASPATNRRTDRWGGSLENRTRFVRSCYQAARDATGEDFPILVKMGAADQAEGGLTLTEGVEMAKLLIQEGFAAIEISEGVEQEPIHHIRTGVDDRDKEAYYLDWARRLRQEVAGPLFLVGGLRSFDIMERIVDEGVVDCVSMCRAFIREPDLVNKYRAGKTQKATCISCNGCIKNLQEGRLACIFDD